MLKPEAMFNGPIMDMTSFARVVRAFSENSSFFYHGWDLQGVDLYPMFPICVESDQGGHMVWIMGLVIGNRPGKALLVSVSKIRGFKSNIHSAFEVLPGIPAEMDSAARQTTLRSIRKRMRAGAAILARRADLVAYNDQRGYDDHLLPALQDSVSDGANQRWGSECPIVRRQGVVEDAAAGDGNG